MGPARVRTPGEGAGGWPERPPAPTWLLAGALVITVAAALVLTVAPMAALLLVLLGVTAVALLALPAWTLAPAVVVAGIATALIRLESEAMAETLGHGRVAALIAGLALAYAVTRGINFRVPRAAFILAAIFGATVVLTAFVGLANGQDPSETFASVQRELSQTIAPLVVALVALSDPRARLPVFRVIGIAILVASAFALINWAWHTDTLTGLPPALESTFEAARTTASDRGVSPDRVIFPFVDTDPNSAAAIFGTLGVFSGTMLYLSGRRADRTLAVVVLAGAAAAVIATQSRMGMAFIPLVGVAYILLSRRVPGVARVLLVGAIAVAAAVFAVMSQDLVAEDRQLTADDANVQSRFSVWSDALDDVGLSPVYGHGLRHAAEPRYHFESLSVHNEYLQRFVDGGLIGGLAFVAVLVGFGAMAASLAGRGGLEGAIGRSALVAMVPLLVSMLMIASWTAVPFLQVTSWLIFGIVAVSYDRARQARTERDAAEPLPAEAAQPA